MVNDLSPEALDKQLTDLRKKLTFSKYNENIVVLNISENFAAFDNATCEYIKYSGYTPEQIYNSSRMSALSLGDCCKYKKPTQPKAAETVRITPDRFRQ